MKPMLDNFNEEDEDDEDDDENRTPSPKYKTKNNKKLEFYKLLQKISSSVKTYSGTTQSESEESGTESDSSNRSKSRSYLSSDSSDGYPSPKPIKKTQANQRPLKRWFTAFSQKAVPKTLGLN